MAFTLEEYAALRPFVYHVTARENLARLRRTRCLETASALLRQGGRHDLLRTRRLGPVAVTLDADLIVLKDQRPLILANLALTTGWTFADLVEYLNHHVYFWPGNAISPVGSGRRLLRRYAPESPIVLRIPILALIAANPHVPPLFDRCNSGAPRMQRGRPVKRGPDLFGSAEHSRFRSREVVEVVFCG